MLKSILRNQTIRIDDHRRTGCSINDWNDLTSDVHIHKEDKKSKENYTIRIPLNSHTPASVEYYEHNRRRNKLPGKLRKEIRDAFSDENERTAFFDYVYKKLAGYGWNYSPKNANEIIQKVADTFGFEPVLQLRIKNSSRRTISLLQSFKDDEDEKYLLIMNFKHKDSHIGGCYLGIMRGIHTAAKNAWINAVFGNLPAILSKETMNERLDELQKIAKTIKGIGDNTVYDTLPYIEEMYSQLHG